MSVFQRDHLYVNVCMYACTGGESTACHSFWGGSTKDSPRKEGRPSIPLPWSCTEVDVSATVDRWLHVTSITVAKLCPTPKQTERVSGAAALEKQRKVSCIGSPTHAHLQRLPKTSGNNGNNESSDDITRYIHIMLGKGEGRRKIKGGGGAGVLEKLMQ